MASYRTLIAVVIGLCILTSVGLLFTPQYQVTGPNLCPDFDVTRADVLSIAGVEFRGPVRWIQDAGPTGGGALVFEGGDVFSEVVLSLPESHRYDGFVLTTQLRSEDLQPGSRSWSHGNVNLNFLDSSRQVRWDWPRSAQELEGTREWFSGSRYFQTAPDTESIQIRVNHHGIAGTMTLASLDLRPGTSHPLWNLVRGVLVALWASLALYCIARFRLASTWSGRAAIGASLVMTFIMMAGPGPLHTVNQFAKAEVDRWLNQTPAILRTPSAESRDTPIPTHAGIDYHFRSRTGVSIPLGDGIHWFAFFLLALAFYGNAGLLWRTKNGERSPSTGPGSPPAMTRFLGATAALLVFATLTEVGQLAIFGRTLSWGDWGWNCAGIASVVPWVLFGARRKRQTRTNRGDG